MTCTKCEEMRAKMLAALGFRGKHPLDPKTVGPVTKESIDRVVATGPEQQRALFMGFAQLSTGFEGTHIVGACMDLIVWALRLVYPTRKGAEERVDALAAQMKEALTKYYNPATGQRSTIVVP